MKRLKIVIDVGDTLLNRLVKNVLMANGNYTYPLFDGALDALELLTQQGHTLIIISKIDRGDEEKVTSYLTHHGIVPRFVKPENLHFCYEREAKAPLAKELGVDVIIDDRVQVHNTMERFGIEGRILYLGSRDDRQEFELTVPVLEARNWLEVMKHINRLSQ
jgi:hypothetical protein